ncbi:MAG: hypothetical protein DRJ65_02790 [Acidobacteria bacterium]|nr:MAG: hypothetical protein DRJ65_02790 [Acidobacteriota bacterium]
MMSRSLLTVTGVALLVIVCLGSFPAEARKPLVPRGVVIMSSGDQVVLVDPASSGIRSLETGPVGFLFPAPGGVLFAPDVVNGRTGVIDLRSGRVVEMISGVTMPHFGPRRDRYLVVAGALTMVSYPERSLIFRMDGEFDRPWQVQLGPEGMTVLILERRPSGEGGTTISAIDIMHRRVVYSKIFDHDLIHFAMAPSRGVMAVIDRTAGDVVLLDSMTLIEVRRLPVPDGATDVVVLSDGKELVVAGASGRLLRWALKVKSDALQVLTEDPIMIPGRTMRLAVGPDGRLVAAATDLGRLIIVDSKKGDVIGEWEIPQALRDFQWVDSQQRGPLLPSWSDSGFGPEGADLGIEKK